MSLQHSGQKSRRLGSPSRVSGPLRATKSFGLGSPSSSSDPLSSSSSSTPLTLNSSSYDGGKRRSSSTTFWTEKLVSPSYSGLTKEKKSIRDNPVETIRRSASFDTIASSYLCGEWPRPSHPLIHLNLVHCPIVLTADKWTQTAEDADEQWDGDCHLRMQQRRSEAPCVVCGGGGGGNGGAGLREMKSRLCNSTKVSPLTCSGCGGSFSGPDGATGLMAPRSNAIVIPVVSRRNPLAPCQGSAEGFNQEIEKLVRNTGTLDSDHDLSKTQALTPDGHRAPIADLLNMRSVNTQTPSSGGPFHSGIEKHFLRILEDSSDDSPCLPIIPGAGDAPPLLFNRPASTESDRSDQCDRPISGTASPESFIPLVKTCQKREAPEGCEKIEVDFSKTTEAPIKREIYHALPPSPVKTNNFLKCLIPSERSAFCPLLKKYVSQQTILSFSLSAAAGNENDNSIEAK